MTYATQLNRTSTPRAGLAKLWADIADILRSTAEASVKIAYDKPWLRGSRYQG